MVGAALLAMGLTYLGVLAWQILSIPPRLHADQDAEIQRVKAMSLSPLIYREKPNDQKIVAWMQDAGPYGHVVLFNQRTDKSVHDVEVHLVRITLLNAKGEPARDQFALDGLPVALVTRDGERRKNIPPEDEEAYVLCEAHWAVDPSDPDKINQVPTQVTIAPGRKVKRGLILPVGRYRLEVVAKGLDIPLRRQTYHLDVTQASFSFVMEPHLKAIA